MLIHIHNSSIFFDDENTNKNTYNYQLYIFKLIQEVCSKNPSLSVNIIFTSNSTGIRISELDVISLQMKPDNQIVRITMNDEHTLVKQGGRDSVNSVTGNIPYNTKNQNSSNYLVRIVNYDILNLSDIVIDYSMPNIINVRESQLFDSFFKKMVYISPFLYEPITNNIDTFSKREIVTLTTFIYSPSSSRRTMLLYNMNKLCYKETIDASFAERPSDATQNSDSLSRIPKGNSSTNDTSCTNPQIVVKKHTNICDCFESEKLKELYKNTKILINVHQTEHHDTLEELRILPALLCGVIVISEYSPLYKEVPYYDYIVWSSYENMIPTVKDVLNNYESYYNKIFGNSKLKEFTELRVDDYNALERKILALSRVN